jgi:hypothetical protein
MASKGIDTPDTGTEDLDGISLDDLLDVELGTEDEDEDDGATEDSDADDDTSEDDALEDEDAESEEEQEEQEEQDEEEDGDEDASGDEEDEILDDDDAEPKGAPENVDDKLVPIKVDGVESMVTVKEARLGYMRTQDYTRKTTEVAEVRKKLEAQTSAYAQVLERLEEQTKLLTGEDRKPDPALRDTDPGEYAAQMADYRALVEYRDSIAVEKRRLAEEAQAEFNTKVNTVKQEEFGKLLDALPAWKDEGIRTKEQRAIVKFMVNRGYTTEELANLVDSRAILLVREALLYNQRKTKAGTVVRKGSGKKKPAPALKPRGNAAPAKGGKTANVKRMATRFEKSRSAEDFASLLALDPNL